MSSCFYVPEQENSVMDTKSITDLFLFLSKSVILNFLNVYYNSVK